MARKVLSEAGIGLFSATALRIHRISGAERRLSEQDFNEVRATFGQCARQRLLQFLGGGDPRAPNTTAPGEGDPVQGRMIEGSHLHGPGTGIGNSSSTQLHLKDSVGAIGT